MLFFSSVPVPELWEWVFPIPVPVPELLNIIPAHPCCIINSPGTSDLHILLFLHVFDICLFVSVVCDGISLLACMQQGELLYRSVLSSMVP